MFSLFGLLKMSGKEKKRKEKKGKKCGLFIKINSIHFHPKLGGKGGKGKEF